MRPFRLLAAVAVGALAVSAASRSAWPAVPSSAAPGTVILSASVGSTASDIMSAALWRRLVAEALAVHAVVPDADPTIADEPRCRAAHAGYAVLATFDRAPRLPGLAQDPDRLYAIARFTVRNCVTGAELPARVVAFESDPIPDAERGAPLLNPAHVWERAVRLALGHTLLGRPVVHVLSVHAGIVTLERGNFALNQVLLATPPAGVTPARSPYELVVTEIVGKRMQATLVGKGEPRPGDAVEAAPPK